MFTPLPQLLRSVRFAGPSPLANAAGAGGAGRGGGAARLGRPAAASARAAPSRVVRVMAEGEDEALVARIVAELCETIAAAAHAPAA